jgi:hypothetical protein
MITVTRTMSDVTVEELGQLRSKVTWVYSYQRNKTIKEWGHGLAALMMYLGRRYPKDTITQAWVPEKVRIDK